MSITLVTELLFSPDSHMQYINSGKEVSLSEANEVTGHQLVLFSVKAA